MPNQNPSINPSDQDSLTGLLDFHSKKTLQAIDSMLPAKVIAFERGPPAFVLVEPQIIVLGTDGEQKLRAQLASIPVVQLGGGGFVMSFDLQPGDMGFIKANDRDISLFIQNLKASLPNTFRLHSFSDAVFLPTILSAWTRDPEDNNCLVMQSLDGTIKASFGNERIKLVAPTILIDSDVTIEGSLTVEDGATISGSGNALLVNGTQYVDGNIAASGTITPNVPP